MLDEFELRTATREELIGEIKRLEEEKEKLEARVDELELREGEGAW